MPVSPVGTSLRYERIDQGVDYGGAGPLFAVDNGVIINTFNAGWPGRTFIVLRFDNPPDGLHLAWYYAEDIEHTLQVGQPVSVGEHIADAIGGPDGIELGFASVHYVGESLAMELGEVGGAIDTPQGHEAYAFINGLPLSPEAGLTPPGGAVQGQLPPLTADTSWGNFQHWIHDDWPNYLTGLSWVRAAADEI